jgi:serine/threonine-protein kinase RIO1
MDRLFITCLQATPPWRLGSLTSQLRRADTSTTPASYLRHTSHRVEHDAASHKHHLARMAHILDQAQTMHDQSTYAQMACDENQECADFLKDMDNYLRGKIEALKRDVSDIDVVFRQHSVDVQGANVGLMALLSLIFFRVVIYMAFIRLGASRPIASVLALSLPASL